MVDKVEDAEMTCKSCGTDLVCHMSNYQAGFENKLQWQNQDGSAHYKWVSAGKFRCVLPEESDESTKSTSTVNGADKKPTQTTIPKVNSLDEDMRYVKNKVDLMFAMISEQFRDYQDRKTQ